jgi:uncharacterized membrane protein
MGNFGKCFGKMRVPTIDENCKSGRGAGNAPEGMRDAASLLTLVAFVFLAAAYVPRNHIKTRFHHPMVLGGKAWALAHLLANVTVADVLLFGVFLIWAVFSFIAARRRDRLAGTTYPVRSRAAGRRVPAVQRGQAPSLSSPSRAEYLRDNWRDVEIVHL